MEKITSKVYAGTAGPMNPIGTANGTSSALFVINLCASIAPVETSGRHLPGLDNYRLYQVARVEDGRTRHRLRLGFFTSEAHAESVLTVVRQQYPTAFTACLCDEDRRFARGYLPDSAIPALAPLQKRPVAAPAAAAQPRPVAAAPVPKPTASRAPAPVRPAAPTVAAPAASASGHPVTKADHAAKPRPAGIAPQAGSNSNGRAANSMRVPALNLTLSEPPPPAPAQRQSSAPSEPFHVGRGRQIADPGISLQADPPAARADEKPSSTFPAKAAPAAAPKTPMTARSTPVTPARTASTATMQPQPLRRATVSPAPVPQARPSGAVVQRSATARLPDLDSTQTIRALTTAELEDGTQEKWFAIQLAASEQPVNLDAMPHLDIFEAYSVYSVAIAARGKITHSLRLGFFKEAVSAEAVSGYLKTFFGSPTVLRVSVAEHARFKDPPARKKSPGKSAAEIIELDSARAARPVIPTVTMEVPAAKIDPGASGSFRTGSTGTNQLIKPPSFKPAAKNAGPATKRSVDKTAASGKYRSAQSKKSLSEQLLDEAREVALSESGIRKQPKNDSLVSRLFGKLTK